MASLLAKVKFLCLHLVCVVADVVPRTIRLLRGQGRGVCSVAATARMTKLFGLAAVDGTPYADPPYDGHIGTILCAFRPHQPVPYDREVTPGGDGNPMCLDWHLCGGSGGRALFVIFPGLASWSGTNYIERFVHYAHRQGFHCVVFNARGLGDTPLEKPRTMSAVWTEDVRAAARRGPLSREAIARRCRSSSGLPVVGVGFSLGGIILSKFTGEECRDGHPPPFDAIFVVNSPLDTLASNTLMMTGFNRFAYQPSMTGGLLHQARLHASVFREIPGLAPDVHADFANGNMENVLRRVHTIEDYDRLITCPANGFASPTEYYTAISPLRWLKKVSIPALCISAADDPVCGPPPVAELRAMMDLKDNLGIVTVPHGGHLGYVRGPVAEWRQLPNAIEKLVCQLAETFAVSSSTAA